MKSTAIASAIAVMAYVLLHWRGIGMDPDSWAAWQGAVSILAGKGYTYFSGHPIHSWPPLYSIYLASWIAASGPTAWTLMISNAVLITLQAALWQHLWKTLGRDSGLAIATLPSIVLSVFIGLFVAVHEQSVFSHNLIYALLPVFLLRLWRLVAPLPSEIRPGNGAILVVLATAMLLTHTSAIAFLVAAAVVLVVRRRAAMDSLILAGLLGAVPVVAWLVVRHALDQDGSHYIGFGAGRYGFLEYVLQLFSGPGLLLVPGKLGAQFIVTLLLWIAAAALAPRAAGLRFGFAIAAISSLVLFAIFNLSWLFPNLSGRFALFVPLLLVPLIYVTAFPKLPRLATLVVVAVAIFPLVYWLGSWGSRQLTHGLAELSFPEHFVSPNVYISRDYVAGPNVLTPRGLLIAPSPDEEPKLRRS